MNTEEKEKLKATILEKLSETRDKVEKFEESSQPIGPDDSIGRVSRMDAINNKSVIEAALRQAKRKLSQLEDALKAIDKPEFGICQRCRQDIPMGRLLLMPESTLCVRCS